MSQPGGPSSGPPLQNAAAEDEDHAGHDDDDPAHGITHLQEETGEVEGTSESGVEEERGSDEEEDPILRKVGEQQCGEQTEDGQEGPARDEDGTETGQIGRVDGPDGEVNVVR